jgi:hypothetical protein
MPFAYCILQQKKCVGLCTVPGSDRIRKAHLISMACLEIMAERQAAILVSHPPLRRSKITIKNKEKRAI